MGNIIGNCYQTGRGTPLLVMLLLCVLSAEAQETASEGAPKAKAKLRFADRALLSLMCNSSQ